MMKGLKRLAAGGILLRELRGIRTELTALRQALQVFTDRAFPPQAPARAPDSVTPDTPLTEITYIDTAQQAEWMDIELRLTQATGRPPTEEEILQEFERGRATDSAEPPRQPEPRPRA